MSVAALSKSLPKPKYTGEEEELTRSTRVLTSQQFEAQVARRQNGPPPYGSRKSWRPRSAEDFADGGAFPEVHVAQYPLDMGRPGAPSKSNALVQRVDGDGKTKYDEIGESYRRASKISSPCASRQMLVTSTWPVLAKTWSRRRRRRRSRPFWPWWRDRMRLRSQRTSRAARMMNLRSSGIHQPRRWVKHRARSALSRFSSDKSTRWSLPNSSTSAFHVDRRPLHLPSCTLPRANSRPKIKKCGRFRRPSAIGRIQRVTQSL
jgi:hypothetical protein